MRVKFSAQYFHDEDAAITYVEGIVWPDGPVCPHCGATKDRVRKLTGRTTRIGLRKCYSCRRPFTVKIGTIFESSHIPLRLWLQAIYLMCSSKKGISSQQIHRILGVGIKTAWFMSHRIRLAMAPVPGGEPPLGGDGLVVEADETYVGKKDGPKGRKARGAGGAGHKRTILSLVERGGQIRSFKIGAPTQHEVKAMIRANVDPASTLHTDGSQIYKGSKVTALHESVDHNKAYVRQGKDEKVHTNTLEGFFSVFKRGMVGTYQHCGEQHLQRYLAEFDFRMNYRIKLGIGDEKRMEIAVEGVTGKRMTYYPVDAFPSTLVG